MLLIDFSIQGIETEIEIDEESLIGIEEMIGAKTEIETVKEAAETGRGVVTAIEVLYTLSIRKEEDQYMILMMKM